MSLSKVKCFAVVAIFVVSTIAAFLSLVMGYPLHWLSPVVWRAWMDIYKGSFGQLLVFLISFTSPTNVRIYSRHENMRFRIKSNGLLQSTLSPRAILMANHQIYSDWMFTWWLAYTSGLESAPIVALKKSLRNVPVVGWAMRWLRFLFLSRNWADDEQNIKENTRWLSGDPSWPVWMLLFPEGTVFNQNTWAKTDEYAHKVGLPSQSVPKNMLLPRVKGLQAILQGLGKTMPVLYDVTIVYEPKPPGTQAAESFYSLKRNFFAGLGPKTIKMHIRELPISQIPYAESEAVFTSWLYEQWIEKDRIYREMAAGNMESEHRVTAPVKLNWWFEILKSFQMPVVLVLVIRLLWKLVVNFS